MDFPKTTILLFAFASIGMTFHVKTRRSIDLSASHSLIPEARLSKDVVPLSYQINLRPVFDENTFKGNITMNLSWNENANKISFHAHHDLNINEQNIVFKNCKTTTSRELVELSILRIDRILKKAIFVIYLKNEVEKGTQCQLEMEFNGYIWNTPEGFFKSSFKDPTNNKTKYYYATNMRPTNARKVFPCFDEPSFKVPYTVSISRTKNYITLFNTELIRTEELASVNNSHYVDYFKITPLMSSFTFGFIISELKKFNSEIKKNVTVSLNIWTHDNTNAQLKEVSQKLYKIYDHLESYFNISVPLSKIDIVAIKKLSFVRPADNWGLLILKESDLLKRGYYTLTQELIYQWLGSWITPFWWSDAHINKALASFLAAHIVMKIDGGEEFYGKYPMTILYSIYYEFSKRYPHSRITAMKQETNSFKTELVMRMLNYVLGEETFKSGIRNFISSNFYETFYSDDLWDALTKEALLNKKLRSEYSVAEIASSWISKDRLPVIKINRDYTQNSAKVRQKVYLRERPHDVPEQDKMLWWIPLVVVQETNLNFFNLTPFAWMEKSRELKIEKLANANEFIIVNPEEIGPFPVNYDDENWYLLTKFLLTDEGRKKLPTYTRAKLLHDAWNLAYAGDLSFAVAFNMTLFMKYERNHIVWNPVFTFIDHIGRHIDVSEVHKKFETYVLALLTPLYEEMIANIEIEELWRNDLISLAKTFLCRAGYRPCIEEAQKAFSLWMQKEDPNIENPVPNQYMCPVFKWGTIDEWEFGLQRIINFPKSRIQSERTYLLKMLAGCPIQEERIFRLLELAIIESNENFKENDIFLIFNMLTGGSSGYTALFKFLSKNWLVINERFQNKTNLWDSMINSATGSFTTQEGYEMVKKLHEEHSGQFSSAEHIIKKSLTNIKEEAKWSDSNLPVIKKWLDNFLNTNQ